MNRRGENVYRRRSASNERVPCALGFESFGYGALRLIMCAFLGLMGKPKIPVEASLRDKGVGRCWSLYRMNRKAYSRLMDMTIRWHGVVLQWPMISFTTNSLFLLIGSIINIMFPVIQFKSCSLSLSLNQLSADWFPPAEASFKRFHIRGLLYELLRDSSQKLTPTCSNGDFPCSGDDVDQGVEFLSAEDSPSKVVNEELVWWGLLDPGSASTPLCATLDDNFEHTAGFESTPTTCIAEVCMPPYEQFYTGKSIRTWGSELPSSLEAKEDNGVRGSAPWWRA
ncbi:hypothetical protein IEQ34_021624 [Dendrobium chrysotoxum]|uniref:Uncharacterized protein n=1 Tax=Dendrobium chrysotoxum TaxID=161865 RepID=A0AAV7G623_DENCH|nr:hypothetical protein IEQ34_021624 [Dendrobium chrysotoxum]